MKLRVSILSAAVGAAGGIIAAVAISAELPKEGAFEAKVILTGNTLQAITVGKKVNEAAVGSIEWDGPWTAGTPFPSMKEHVVQLFRDMNGVVEFHGYDVNTDSDGDRLYGR